MSELANVATATAVATCKDVLYLVHDDIDQAVAKTANSSGAFRFRWFQRSLR